MKKETIDTPKKQTAKLSGSFHNYLMANNASIPVVGKGATKLHYSDRSCYEVIEVSEDGKTVKLEELDAEWDKTKEGGMGHQNWILKPTGRFTTVVWRNNGWKIKYDRIEYTKDYLNKILSVSAPEAYKLKEGLFDPETLDMIEVEGKTKNVTKYDKINLLFGQKNYYYDWEF